MKAETFLEKVERYIRSLGEKIESLRGSFTQAHAESPRRLGYCKDEASEDLGTPESELNAFKYVFEEVDKHRK